MVIESKSLFDYLGKPAGDKLGLEVHAAAVKKDVWIGQKAIEKHIVPSGYVCTYPVSFLDEYFNKTSFTLEDRIEALEARIGTLEKKLNEIKTSEINDDLPF